MTGDYDAHSQYQRAVADTGSQRIRDCVGAVPVGGTAPFVVADYGCATGANSSSAMQTAVDAVRAEGHRVVVALHNDLPTNDWNRLFANVSATPDEDVLHLASAVSFFRPAAPAGSVHLGMSFSAAHWLRDQPDVSVPDGCYFCEATGAARAELAKLADADWTTFLRARAADLAPGGRLLVQMVGTDDAGDVTARRLLRAVCETADGMVDDGLVDRTALRRYLLPVYARTVEEARRPVARSDVPFTEVECRTDPVANPYLQRWRSDHDAGRYATDYAAFVRGFTESSLRAHLFAGAPDVDRAVDELFRRLAARFRADPERDRFEDWTLTVVLARD
jgi:hypothetical protein